MALKRLPVLFFVAESTAKGRLQPRKGLRDGREVERKSAHKSLLHFEICIQVNEYTEKCMKNTAEKVWKNKMQHVKCDETILKTVKRNTDVTNLRYLG